ncbi:MAG TPA: retropepsin-like aspartic protease [Bryobacteraceae bacterium]|nr:retropepsin-like aspartic protease [Bryobacteraceae bacterium]
MIEIPFRMLREGVPIIVLPVFINGEGPFDFVLDTGNAVGQAALALISETLGQRLSIEAVESKDFRGAYAVGDTHRPEILAGRVDSLALGEVVRRDVPVGITAIFDRLGEQIGAPIHGNIGNSFLKDYAVSIDYKHCTLRLERGGGSVLRGEPFRLSAPYPVMIVPVWVNGQGPYDFAVDTGAGHTIISERLAEELALVRGRDASVKGGAGDTGGFWTEIDTLEAAGANCGRMPVVASGFFPSMRAASGEPLDGIIGYNVLRHYTVVIDYPGSTIALTSAG